MLALLFKKFRVTPRNNLLFFTSIYVLFALNLIFPVISFTDPFFNAIAVAFFLTIPILLIINGFFFGRWWQKLVNLLIFVPPSAISLLIAIYPILFLLILTYQPYQELTVNNYNLAVYKNIQFFTDRSRGFAIKQEKVIIPGIKLMNQIYENSNLSIYKLEYQMVDEDKVSLKFIYYDSRSSEEKSISQVVELKRYLFF